MLFISLRRRALAPLALSTRHSTRRAVACSGPAVRHSSWRTPYRPPRAARSRRPAPDGPAHIQTTGQSGNPLSGHYDALRREALRDGRSLPMFTDRAAVEEDGRLQGHARSSGFQTSEFAISRPSMSPLSGRSSARCGSRSWCTLEEAPSSRAHHGKLARGPTFSHYAWQENLIVRGKCD